ncbi:MAG TPA: DUF4230 domain-containing protein, partial [Bryobacteraceae bacterium]|nr:DUF4230 domain-containing protein [Bryobacteraceae bacterium]
MREDRLKVALAVALAGAAVLCFLLMRGERRPELDSRAVVLQVRQLNELATVRYTVQKIVGLKEQRYPLGSESILLIMQAGVHAGVNLSALKADDVTIRSDGTVVVRIPPPKILSISVDEKETKVWDRQKTWWTPWVPYDIDLERRARMEGLKSIQEAALAMGILSQAEQNADSAIRGLLKLAGVSSVVITPRTT